jgi:hypothetical protein
MNIPLNGQAIKKVDASKYLGIHLDDNLNWNTHINSITSKLNSLTAAFYNLAQFIDNESVSRIYYAYVFPHIKYGIEIYGNCNSTALKKIQVMQNKILKILSRKPWRYSTNQLHYELKILKCSDIHKLFTGVFVCKQQHDELPDIFSSYFKKK